MFASDIIKEFDGLCTVEFVRVNSYAGIHASEISEFSGFHFEIKNKTIVLLEDILDSGKTISFLIHKLEKHQQ